MAQHEDVVVFYDNFDYLQKPRHQVIADHGVMYNYTTAKMVRGFQMPQGGLRQSMLHPDVVLEPGDLLRSKDIRHDSVWEQTSTFVIAEAIKRVYPEAVKKIFEGAEDQYPSMPQLDVLPNARTEHVTLGPILESESTVAGNYNVLENIFLQQFNLNPESDFSDLLYLVFGDLKTLQLIQSCKQQRSEASTAYSRHNWVLPVPGLWHLRLNFLQMVMKNFYGGKKYSDQYSTLYSQMNYLDRRNIPKEKAPFHHMEELVLQSFDARLVALLYIKIGDKCDVKKRDEVQAYLSNLSVPQFLRLINDIRNSVLDQKVMLKASQVYRDTPKDSVPQIDMEFVNHVRYLKVVQVYIILKYSIKHADIGLLKRAIAWCCLLFNGSTSRNYAQGMLYLYRLIATDACDPELRRAILSCGLVNLRGKPDTFFEADRLVELLNLQLKELLWARGNSTFDVDLLFQWSLPIINYLAPLKANLELTFGEHTNTEHTVKSPGTDIHTLAELLVQDSIKERRHRHVAFHAKDLAHHGYSRIIEGGLAFFNAEMAGDGFNDNNNDENNREADDDLPDLTTLSRLVSLPVLHEIVLMT